MSNSKENRNKDLQSYADLGKELLKKDGLWDSAISDIEKRKKPSYTKRFIVALALIAAIALGFLIFGKQLQSEPLHMAYFEAVPTSLVPNVRVANGGSKTTLQKAVMAYGDRNYDEAQKLFIPLIENDNSDFAKLYLASIYISQNKNKEATHLLTNIQSAQLNDFVEWNLALSLLSQDTDRAKVKLLEIANNEAHFRSKKASEILQKEFGY